MRYVKNSDKQQQRPHRCIDQWCDCVWTQTAVDQSVVVGCNGCDIPLNVRLLEITHSDKTLIIVYVVSTLNSY